MAYSAPHHSNSCVRDRLARQLQEENQRMKLAVFQATNIDPEALSTRYEALVSAMLDALERTVSVDNEVQDPQTAEQQADLFDRIKVERGVLNALVAQLRSGTSDDESTADPYLAKGQFDSNPGRVGADEPASFHATSIDWENLAKRMDALREQVYRDIEENRSNSRMPAK